MAPGAKQKPTCKYGSKCYRKNQQHLQKFHHPDKDDENDNEASVVTAKRTISHLSEVDDDTSPSQSKKFKSGNSSDAVEEDAQDSDAVSKSDIPSCSSDAETKDLDDIDLAPSPVDVKENIKRKFLVDMPDDFYQFWEFCKCLNPKDPLNALAKSLKLHLVGPFDILQNKHKGIAKNKHGRQPNYLLHYRYFYDPPEFQTVLASKVESHLHFGYYRDDPKELPVFVASNSPGDVSKEKIVPCGDNLFAAVHLYALKVIKTSTGEAKKLIEKLLKSLEQEAGKLGLSLATSTKGMKDRQKKVVCPTFHGAGIVVPVDANEVGYRPVPETPANLRAMFKKIVDSKTEDEREKSSDELQELITYVQFANDECDYGEGLELGLDLFMYGSKELHPQISSLLPLAYQLLKRPEFSNIIEEHLQCRRNISECIDELAL